jgi:hypothetical protein
MGKVSKSPLADSLFTSCNKCVKTVPTHPRLLVEKRECWYKDRARRGCGCTNGKKEE